MKKYHIKRNSVQETLLLPLYARSKSTELYPEIFKDPKSAELIQKIDYDFSTFENNSQKLMQRFGYLECAMRQYDLMSEVKEYLEKNPEASVVNIGCGLDQTGENCDNGTCKIYNLDFPDVIEARNQMIPSQERVRNIGVDINDISWFKEIDKTNGVVFFAAGVFYYFQKKQFDILVSKMAVAFPMGMLVFDAANKKACRMMIKSWVQKMGISDVDAFFCVENVERDISSISKNFVASYKGYMLGYHNLKLNGVSDLFRWMAWIGDNLMKMRIIRLDFR